MISLLALGFVKNNPDYEVRKHLKTFVFFLFILKPSIPNFSDQLNRFELFLQIFFTKSNLLIFQINFWTDHKTNFVVEKLVGVIVREVDL